MSNGWIEWNGTREMPVPASERVDVRWLDGEEFIYTRASDWKWQIPVEGKDLEDGAGVICAYRICNSEARV